MRGLTATGAFTAWMSVLIAVLGVGAAMMLTIAYVGKVDREAEERNIQRSREICGIIRIIDDRNREMPASPDPATTEFRRELHAYRVSLGC